MRETLTTDPDGDHPVPADPITHATPHVLSPPNQAHAPVPPDHTRDHNSPDQACAPIPYGDLDSPGDLYLPEDPDDPDGPRFIAEQDQWDAELDDLLGRNRRSRVDDFEWEEWHGVDQDDAERALLALEAPAWVFLPPGGQLATAVEDTQPQSMSPIALIELMKATGRQTGWIEALKAEAIASFIRQRRAEHAASPRPVQYDTTGRPIDPERSWYAELALALGVTKETIARRATTALRLTGPLRATHTALKCGALTWSKALAISEATADLPDHTAQAVEAHVLKRAASQTHKNMLESLRRQVAKHRVAEDADDHRAAVADRTCKIVPLANGMAGLWIVNTADKIQQMWITIQAIATLAKRHGPTNTPGANPSPTDESDPAGATAHTTPTDTTPTPAPAPAPADTGPPTTTPTPSQPGPGTTDDDAITTPGDGAINDAPTEHHSTDERPADTTATAEPTADLTATPAAVPTPDPPTSAANDAYTSTPDSVGGAMNNARTSTPDSISDAVNDARVTTTDSDSAVKDTRTAEQRRADVTADLFEHILHNGLDWLGHRLPDQHRRRPHIEVIIPATTLLGLDNNPAELTGYGPIPAHLARRIATNGTWRRLLTDPTNGTVLEASTTRHDPGTLITETLLARHPVCAWPGCNRTSRECDRDHTTPYTQTGQTSLTGLAPYCEYHHVIKDTPAWGWTSTSHPDGSITLTTPTGHRYTTVPPARGPITQQALATSPGNNSPVSSDQAKRQSPRIRAARSGANQPASKPADDPPPF